MLPLPKVSPLLLLAALLGGCYNDAAREKRLVEHGVRAKAVIAVDSCDKRFGIRYDFVVDSKTYRGIAPPDKFNCYNTNLGESVSIVYDPQNPGSNTIVDPQILYEQAVGWHIPIWIAIPLIFVGINFFIVLKGLLPKERSQVGNANAAKSTRKPR